MRAQARDLSKKFEALRLVKAVVTDAGLEPSLGKTLQEVTAVASDIGNAVFSPSARTNLFDPLIVHESQPTISRGEPLPYLGGNRALINDVASRIMISVAVGIPVQPVVGYASL